jgi:aminomethyltransferase
LEKKTPLYDWHVSHGGKMISFAGYLLPVQYETGLIAEHTAVREKAGLFDVSHMGELLIRGRDALKNLQYLVTGDLSGMKNGGVRYSLLCNEQGGIVDDLVVCRMDEERCLLVVNAANRDKDAAWIAGRLSGDAFMEDLSEEYAQIAIQGPLSPAILKTLSGSIPEKYYTFIESGSVAGIPCIVSRTGYTGETGFELYCPPSAAASLWERLLPAGEGIIPCGLGSRDTLRLEAGMPLYGHEMNESVNPFEAGLAFAVSMDKGDFIGKAALAAGEKPERIRAGIRITGRGIARGGETVFVRGKEAGTVSSGTFSPWSREAIAMALIRSDSAEIGTRLEIDIRGRMVEALICSLPFYKHEKR